MGRRIDGPSGDDDGRHPRHYLRAGGMVVRGELARCPNGGVTARCEDGAQRIHRVFADEPGVRKGPELPLATIGAAGGLCIVRVREFRVCWYTNWGN